MEKTHTTFINQNEEFEITPVDLSDVETIVEFQKQLAYDSEKVTLDEDRTREAIKFVLANPVYGVHFMLRKVTRDISTDQNDEKISKVPVAFVLMCPERDITTNQDIWWYNSVYTAQKYRRRGLFGAIHQFIKQWVSPNLLKLYADQDNQGALICYSKLGLVDDNEAFFEVDFFFSGPEAILNFKRDTSKFTIYLGTPVDSREIKEMFFEFESVIKEKTDESDIPGNLHGLESLLENNQFGGIICVREQNKLTGLVVFGYEYSEWKRGFNVIVTDFRVSKQSSLENKVSLTQNIVNFLRNDAQLEAKVKSVRFIANKHLSEAVEILQNAQLQLSHYLVLSCSSKTDAN